jgi:hypothetical protein
MVAEKLPMLPKLTKHNTPMVEGLTAWTSKEVIGLNGYQRGYLEVSRAKLKIPLFFIVSCALAWPGIQE